jgi:hypothetical protein
MSEAAARIARLPPQKLALFLEGVKKRARNSTQIRLAPRQEGENRFPLSYAQQRLWFLDRLQPGTTLFNMPSAWRLEGRLDARSLAAAFTEVSRRHESLRTSFVLHEGQPVQMVSPPGEFSLPLIDLTELPEPARMPKARRLAAQWAKLPFDLARGPLLRACLLRLGAERHALVLTLHHIITDGWSSKILFRELSALYDSGARGEVSPLPELEAQYGDYAVWQRARLQDQLFEKQLAYWREQLSGASPLLELPTDRPRAAAPAHPGAACVITLSKEVTEGIRALNQHEGVTLFMSMLAAFKALLCRYSGQEEIIVGSPLAGRNHRQTEALIGFFINTLVLRTNLSGNLTFRELLARVRETYLAAHANQDVPFERLVAELQPDRSRGQSPFFQVWFALQNVGGEKLKFADLALTPLNIAVKTAQFDLTLSVWEEQDFIGAFLIYDTELFDVGTATQFLEDYKALLCEIVARPEQRILEIPLRPTDADAELAGTSSAEEIEAEPEDLFTF